VTEQLPLLGDTVKTSMDLCMDMQKYTTL